jgi:hypothetical protein
MKTSILYKLGVFEKRVMRLKFGPKKEEITEGFMICELMKEDEMYRA